MTDAIVGAEQRVLPVELFFDLIFAFAFTQVTSLWLGNSTWSGLGQGLLVLLVLWWVWESFAWLTNVTNVEANVVLAVMLVATAFLFVAAIAVPAAFTADRLVFSVMLFVVLCAFVALYALVSKREPDQLAAVLRMTRFIAPAAAVLLGAAFVPTPGRPVLMALAFVIGFFGPQLSGPAGWRVYPAHFAERHGLILIIAIGESLGAIGFTARVPHLGIAEIVAAVLGLVVAASFWLAYFDFASRGVQQLLEERRGEDRIALARDAYSYLHVPMVAGILLFAFAMRSMLGHVGSDLRVVPAVALCGGPALYLLAFVALRWRFSHALGRGRPIAAVVLLLLIPVAVFVPALVGLAAVAGTWIGLHAYELIWWREQRAQRRAHVPPPTSLPS